MGASECLLFKHRPPVWTLFRQSRRANVCPIPVGTSLSLWIGVQGTRRKCQGTQGAFMCPAGEATLTTTSGSESTTWNVLRSPQDTNMPTSMTLNPPPPPNDTDNIFSSPSLSNSPLTSCPLCPLSPQRNGITAGRHEPVSGNHSQLSFRPVLIYKT